MNIGNIGNIGIISTWFARGSGQIAKQIIQAINWHTDYSVALLARMSFAGNSKQICFWGEYFHDNILLFPTYQIDDASFEQWVKANKIDTVIFVEEQFTTNLVDISNRLGIKSINYIVWENFNPSQLNYYKQFTYLVCPTKCTYDLLKNEYLLNNSVYISWGVDLDTYTWQEPVKKDKPVIFFPAGWGGVADRKNEKAVIDAFSYICPRDKAIMHIHTQQEGQKAQAQNIIKTSSTVTSLELINYYKESDLVVLPSRFEGNCLPQMESLALGRPIIVTDCQPLNERVVDGVNGYLIKVKELKEVSGIFVKSAEVDVWDFATKLILLENKDLLHNMQIASRKYAEAELNWFVNSKKLVDLLV